VNFTQSIAHGFRNFGNSAGRASRSEYWYWTLFTLLIDAASFALDHRVFPTVEWGPVGLATGLLLLLPNVAVSMRRLHDINRSGRWVLLAVTVVGLIPLFYWALRKGTDGENDFGPDPLAAGPSDLPRDPAPSAWIAEQ
jgi:uncharacterized membrane protein YhaH (DUF805 family)